MCACSQSPWTDANRTTASFTATGVGTSVVIDVQWTGDFAAYFQSAGTGSLSAVILSVVPSTCQQSYNKSVAVTAVAENAQLVTDIPRDLYDRSMGQPVRTAYILIRLAWVSVAPACCVLYCQWTALDMGLALTAA